MNQVHRNVAPYQATTQRTVTSTSPTYWRRNLSRIFRPTENVPPARAQRIPPLPIHSMTTRSMALRNQPSTSTETLRPLREQASSSSESSLGSKQLQSKKGFLECYICYENALTRTPVMTNCGHVFCRDCLRRSLTSISNCCPYCRSLDHQYRRMYPNV